MRVFRVIQLLVVLALIGYLLVLHSVNPQTIILPFLISLPTSWVLSAALVLGFVVGWLSLSSRVWRLSRENRTLRQKLIKAGSILETPVIPDRKAAQATRTPAPPPEAATDRPRRGGLRGRGRATPEAAPTTPTITAASEPPEEER